MPPKNYLWCRHDNNGQIVGVYEFNGVKWIRIPTSGGGEGGNIAFIDSNGDSYNITDIQEVMKKDGTKSYLINAEGLDAPAIIPSEETIINLIQDQVNNITFDPKWI